MVFLQAGVMFGPFALGSRLKQVFTFIRSSELYSTSEFEILFADQLQHKHDIVISFPSLGFHLKFDSFSQSLYCIDIFQPDKIEIEYSSVVSPKLGPMNVVPDVMKVSHLHVDMIRNVYGEPKISSFDSGLSLWQFPGVSFVVPNESAIASRIIVIKGYDWLEKKAFHSNFPLVYVVPGQGIYLTSIRSWITFDMLKQDITSRLGDAQVHTSNGNYYLNYFDHGFDFYLNSSSHVLKRIILHTNCPWRYDFGKYEKCNFCVLLPKEEFSDLSTRKRVPSLPIIDSALTRIGSQSNRNEIEEVFGKCIKETPYTRLKSDSVSDFDHSIFLQYKNVTFEIMPNEYLASIQIFCDK